MFPISECFSMIVLHVVNMILYGMMLISLDFSKQRQGVKMMAFWMSVKMISSLEALVTKQMQMMNGQIKVLGIFYFANKDIILKLDVY